MTVHLVQLAIAVVFAIAGYQEAGRFERQTGRTPWGWRPWVWALALGLSFFIGLLLLAIAERQGKKNAKRRPAARPVVPAAPSHFGGPPSEPTPPRW